MCNGIINSVNNKKALSLNKSLNGEKTVSAIVPFYNEEKTLATVVTTLLNNSLIGEVICINDGSTDKSLETLKSFGNKVRVVSVNPNRGKGNALSQGIKAARGEIVAFFDADLLNLSDAYISMLLKPILMEDARAVLGYPSSDSKLPELIAGYSGERAYYRKDLMPHVKKMSKTGFGVEVYLNRNFGNTTLKIPLKGLAGPYKHQKYSSTFAFKEYMGEAREITVELAKTRMIKAEDYKIVKNFNKIRTIKEFRNSIKNINDSILKEALEKYVLKYLQAEE